MRLLIDLTSVSLLKPIKDCVKSKIDRVTNLGGGDVLFYLLKVHTQATHSWSIYGTPSN